MTQPYRRYAVYYAPARQSAFASLGAAWLGWDADVGCAVAHPDLDLPRPLAEITATPRKYGLHGTLKAPMQLAPGVAVAEFLDAVETLSADIPPVDMGTLTLARLGHFLALVPQQQSAALEALAARVVTKLDHFRAPPSSADLARRRAVGLSAAQDAMLVRWGYPYVLDELRFHITLTGKMDPDALPAIEAAARDWFAPVLATPQIMSDLSVFGEDQAGRFHLVKRFALRG